jgi:hypothetical protein
LRLIWEYTWPEARVIEAAHVRLEVDDLEDDNLEDDDLEDDQDTDDEDLECTVLRPTSSFISFLRRDFSSRVLENSKLGKCLPPAALWVCHESRQHTLKKYEIIRHLHSPTSLFPFSPTRDILWLSDDLDDQSLKALQSCYGESLRQFQSILVEIDRFDKPKDRNRNLF